MVDIMKTVKGALMFPVGYLVTIISWYLFPALIEILPNNFSLEAIMWFCLFLVWFISMIVLPVGMAVDGIRRPKTNDNGVMYMTEGAVIWLFGVALTVVGWNLIVINAVNLLPNLLTKGMFWIGFLGSWGMVLVVMPFMVFTKAKSVGG